MSTHNSCNLTKIFFKEGLIGSENSDIFFEWHTWDLLPYRFQIWILFIEKVASRRIMHEKFGFNQGSRNISQMSIDLRLCQDVFHKYITLKDIDVSVTEQMWCSIYLSSQWNFQLPLYMSALYYEYWLKSSLKISSGRKNYIRIKKDDLSRLNPMYFCH